MAKKPGFPRWAAAYLFLQTAGVLVWWGFVLGSPGVARYFFLQGDSLRFLIPDLLFFVVLGGVAAGGIFRNKDWARFALWGLAGGSLYATALDAVYAFQTGVGWLGPILMAPTVLIPSYLCWRAAR